ncbi:MAG: hypothetical protein K6T73_08320 [Candidatus Bathyarchaeota archaeon]|nr:hypothetical protein [Candidatus Bathyarchaeota archaeon]
MLKKYMIAVAMILLLLIVFLLALHSSASTEAGENLEQLVRNEMGEYITKNPYRDGDCIYFERWLLRYNVPGKGIIDMGEMWTFQGLEEFLKELASKPDVHAYITNLKEKIENPTQYPNATFVGGDPIDDSNVTLSANSGTVYRYSYAQTIRLSFAVSLGLWGGDEAQRTIIDLRVTRSGLVDHQIWKRVFHFEQTDGRPGNALSLTGNGETFEIIVFNDDPTSQTFRVYRSLQVIP